MSSKEIETIIIVVLLLLFIFCPKILAFILSIPRMLFTALKLVFKESLKVLKGKNEERSDCDG